MHCTNMLQDFFNQLQAATFMFAEFDLAALQNSLILQQIFCSVQAQLRMCTSQLLHMQNDIKQIINESEGL